MSKPANAELADKISDVLGERLIPVLTAPELWRIVAALRASARSEEVRRDEIIEILSRHIEMDWLNASDGHPDITGFGKAADAILAAQPAEAPAGEVRDAKWRALMSIDGLGRPTGDDAYYAKAAYDRVQDRWSDCLATIDSVSANPARKGEYLDIRIVGPGCSITLLSLDDLRELISRARS